MTALWQNFLRDENGLILSAELVIILTITVLGMVVGLVNLQQGLLGEFADLGLAFQSLNQSYGTPSYYGCRKWWGRTSWVAGSSFIDIFDGCVGGGPGNTYQGGEIIGGGTSYYVPQQTTSETPCLPSTSSNAPLNMGSSTVIPYESSSPTLSPSPASGPCSTCP